MDVTSPIFAALGVAEFDAMNDLADWLDSGVEPAAGTGGHGSLSGDRAARAAARSVGLEG
jgi:hypothetical protein